MFDRPFGDILPFIALEKWSIPFLPLNEFIPILYRLTLAPPKPPRPFDFVIFPFCIKFPDSVVYIPPVVRIYQEYIVLRYLHEI